MGLIKEPINWINVEMAAKALGVSKQTIYRETTKRKRLPYTRVGHSIRIDEADLERYRIYQESA